MSGYQVNNSIVTFETHAPISSRGKPSPSTRGDCIVQLFAFSTETWASISASMFSFFAIRARTCSLGLYGAGSMNPIVDALTSPKT